MPEFAGPVIVLAAAVVAILLFVLAWRMTRGRSLAARTLVRGGLLLLITVPLVAFAFISVGLPPAMDKIDGRLSGAPRPDEIGEMAQERGQNKEARRDQQDGQGQLGTDQAEDRPLNPNVLPDAAAPGAGGTTPPSSDTTDGYGQGPLVIEPPPAANGGSSAPETEVPGRPAAPDEGMADGAADRGRMAMRRSAEEPEQSDWAVVPVFYGTDRAVEPNDTRLTYGSDRGRRLELGRALVTVPKVHQIPQIERPWALRIPYFDVTIYEETEDPKKHFTMQEIRALPKDAFLALVRERLAASQRFKDHAIVFVHGFNTAFDNAVYRTGQIAYDLDFDGAPFLYSWPSGGAVASYTYDRESAEASVPYLREFLEMVVKETGAKSISIIAHSMGNQPLLEVLKDMRSQTPEGVVIDQLISAAPDVDADSFTNMANRIEGFAKGVTLYAAANDRALIISRNFWRNPRAGDVPAAGPLIVTGVDTIDVTGVSTDALALNHSGYAENNDLLQDIGKLIQNGLRPPDQRLPKLQRVPTDKGDYWRYVQGP
jgi:esterase/lipase superfamily enzyme